jgi:NADPH-dependent curcumin reductase CurA
LIRTLYLSLDPTNRIWMGEKPSYLPPVPIDAVMRGVGAGQVVVSKHDDMKPGDHVTGTLGWQEYAIAGDGPDATEVTTRLWSRASSGRATSSTTSSTAAPPANY